MNPHQAELDVALEVARTAGQHALDLQRAGREALEIRDKGDGEGPVTRADLDVQAAIVAALQEHFPRDSVLGEEGGPPETGGPRRWIIDPVDGTKDFAAERPCWAIHIGLAIEGKAVLGVIAEPATDRITWGVPGVGAALIEAGESRPLVVATSEKLRLVSSLSHRNARIDDLAQLLGIGPDDHVQTGSVGVKVARLTRGESELYVHPGLGTKLWDTCAPEAVLRAAGGDLRTVRGEHIDYARAEVRNDDGIFATAGVDAEALLAKTAALRAAWGLVADSAS